ncbi:MAG: hypothetical protein MZV70_38210 [Desulfobacterales bacterium]|nr:hypothetical protein [Desulfobacterales bacterium]
MEKNQKQFDSFKSGKGKMRRFWVVLLLLGLIAAFSTSAMAVDVKFSGEYSVTGMYLDRTSLQEDVGPSTAFFYQRPRLKTEFVVAPGLSLVTRADIMERASGRQQNLILPLCQMYQ